MSNENGSPVTIIDNISDDCLDGPLGCLKCSGEYTFDGGWDLICQCYCHNDKSQFQEVAGDGSKANDGQIKQQPIKEVILNESQTDTDTSWLKAKINGNGSLVLEGYDIGKTPLKYWGKDEYEYWRTVDNSYKDSILLLLIKDRFKYDSAFEQWLDEKGIPSKFNNWV